MGKRILVAFVVAGGVLAPAGAAMATADAQAPCMGQATSMFAVQTKGEQVRETAVSEAKSGAIRVVVPLLAQSPECPSP